MLREECACPAQTTLEKTEKKVYLERDRKNRKGKTVTVISNLTGDLKSMQRELQRLCGAGGAVKNGVIEIQGDQRIKIRQYLEKKGYLVVARGG